MDPKDNIPKADALITKSGFKYPDDSLLQTFLRDAVDEELAASYLLQKCSNSTVEQFLEDWKSLLSLCKYLFQVFFFLMLIKDLC